MSSAEDLGFSPQWYAFKGDEEQVYEHDGEDVVLRLAVWGARSWPAAHSGRYYADSYETLAHRCYRVPITEGQRLRMLVGGRPTKLPVTSGSITWASGGTEEDYFNGLCQVGGFPDGGNGAGGALVVPYGPTDDWALLPPYVWPPNSTTRIDRWMGGNGGGGSTQVWLDDDLIIVEPGTGCCRIQPLEPPDEYEHANYNEYRGVWGVYELEVVHEPSGDGLAYLGNTPFRWDWWLPYSGGSAPSDLPGESSHADTNDSYLLTRQITGETTFEYPAAVASSPPAAGPRPHRDAPDLGDRGPTGFPFRGRWGFDAAREGRDGGARHGADAAMSSYGPTSAGGGGWGGGGGGPAVRTISGPSDDYDGSWPPVPWKWGMYGVILDTWNGRMGGRFWRSDLVDRTPWVAPDLGYDPRPDVIVTDPDTFEVAHAGPEPYWTDAPRSGCGAVWLCPEDPEGEAGWVVGRIAAGHLASITQALSDLGL